MIRSDTKSVRRVNAPCVPGWRASSTTDRRSPRRSGRNSSRIWDPTDADPEEGEARRFAHSDIHRRALQAARQAVLAMRASDEIGDDAFHQMEEELDWIEMAGGGKEEAEPER